MIPYAKQAVSKKDIKEVVKVLKSEYLTQGPMVPNFEKAVASYCGAKFKNWEIKKFSALSLNNEVFGAITFGSSVDWDLAYYGIPVVLLKREGGNGRYIEEYRDINYFSVAESAQQFHSLINGLSNQKIRRKIIQNAQIVYQEKFKDGNESKFTDEIINFFY